MAGALSRVVCCKEDVQAFIKDFLSLDKTWYRQMKAIGSELTVSCRYTAAHLRLIISTPCDVLSLYDLTFINDQVVVTISIME